MIFQHELIAAVNSFGAHRRLSITPQILENGSFLEAVVLYKKWGNEEWPQILANFFESKLIVVRNRDEIPQPYIWLLLSAIGNDFLLVGDKALSYRIAIAYDVLQSKDIRRIDWRARFLDFNLIKNVSWKAGLWSPKATHNAGRIMKGTSQRV